MSMTVILPPKAKDAPLPVAKETPAKQEVKKPVEVAVESSNTIKELDNGK